jgi:hypothetical protein
MATEKLFNGASDETKGSVDPLAPIPPDLLASIVAFLRDWFPEEAKRTYRAMIAEDPDHWHRHPHFAGGIIPEHALRGNGITEKVLGVKSLDDVWPALLARALEEEEPLAS